MIGQRIKEIRNNNNLTQEELADGIISRTYLSLIEKGSVHPSTNVLIKLSDRLSCSINDFMTEVSQFKYNDIEVLREIAYYEFKVKNGDFEHLEQFMSKRYEKLEEIPVVDCGRIHLIYALYFDSQGEREKAGQHVDEALKRLSLLSYNQIHIDAIDLRTNILIAKEKYLEALDQLEDGLDILIKMSDMEIGIVRLLHNMAKCYYLIGEYVTAQRLIDRIERKSQALHIDYKREERMVVKVKTLVGLKDYEHVLEIVNTINSPTIDLFYCYSKFKLGKIKESVNCFKNLENKIDELEHDRLSLKVYEELNDKLGELMNH